MKNHLISGGCGFVGRNMVKRLYKTTKDRILFIDNLSVERILKRMVGRSSEKRNKRLENLWRR